MGCGVSMNARMSKSEKAIKAAILIQRWYRRYLARLEARRMCTWRIFQSIEYHNEQDQLKLHNFFIDMMDHIGDPGPVQETQERSRFPVLLQEDLTTGVKGTDKESEEDVASEYESISVPPEYTGLRLHFPLTVTQVTQMVEYFREKKALHARYAIQLLHEARKRLRLMGNINKATTGVLHEITICGDLHGSLDDLFVVFYKNGLPSPETPYVFNGDFVDRGPHSVEIALLLLAFLLVYPYQVFLNRGNHEDYNMNLRYGFIKEIIIKYKKNASVLVKHFRDVFSWLPLATIIDKKIFIAHGGISDTTDLECIATLERHKYITVLMPPSCDEDPLGILTGRERIDLEWRQVLDLLWSDPRGKLGCGPNTFRGGGCYFGPDVTGKFLKENDMQLIIRSHECKYEGYEFTHNGQVLTIFSASNYYEEGSNRGAYVKIGPDLQPRLVQYMCTSFHTEKEMALSQRSERLSIIEKAAIVYLKEECYANKTALMEAFRQMDPSDKGVITLRNWIKTMTSVLNLDLPWRALKNQLVTTPDRDLVYYKSLFETFAVSHRFKETSFTEAMYRCRHELETIFRAMDKDNSGFISMDEFEESCHILSQHMNTPLPDDVIKDMAYSMDFNHDGCIDFNEFLEAFRLVDGDFKRPCSEDT
ncbi:serine/threonine-protein phosphatase with EF-hands 2-like isoform X1 [Branchiostoma lanceolatum]|uniref:serine/threonine-protein phosphatase with EF-hands 2-like isoform X1 n=1 Tax=Branchiostoma lanceolatum TaxID=7740 RepID=UPI0034539A95